MLSEDGAVTLRRLVKSTIMVVEEISSYLIDLWQRRRADPSLLEQPTKQWELVPSRSPAFAGYDPGSVKIGDSGQLHVNPQLGQRMRAAALLNDQRDRWATWTGE